jgi:single-strand DNA-binding protein
MANFNKVILVGNLTREPQLSYLPSQTPVVDFGLAINRKWASKEGEGKEEVCFIDCRAFGKSADNINKYCKKGDIFMVEGRLSFEQWTAQDGSKKSRHRVIVEGFQFLQGKPQGEAQPDEQQAETPADKPPKDDIPF